MMNIFHYTLKSLENYIRQKIPYLLRAERRNLNEKTRRLLLSHILDYIEEHCTLAATPEQIEKICENTVKLFPCLKMEPSNKRGIVSDVYFSFGFIFSNFVMFS